MDNIQYKKAFCEILFILENMDTKIVSRIPIKLIEFFKANKLKFYIVNLSTEVSLCEQVLLEETKAILAFLCRKYLCEDDIKDSLEKKFQEEVRMVNIKAL